MNFKLLSGFDPTLASSLEWLSRKKNNLIIFSVPFGHIVFFMMHTLSWCMLQFNPASFCWVTRFHWHCTSQHASFFKKQNCHSREYYCWLIKCKTENVLTCWYYDALRQQKIDLLTSCDKYQKNPNVTWSF